MTRSPRGSLAPILTALLLAAAFDAHAHDRARDYAATLARRALLQPANVALRLELAEILRASGALERAATELDAVDRLAPDHPGLRRCRAALLRDQGRPVEAEAMLDSALARAPGDAAALRMRAQLRGRRAAIEDADADYRAAIAVGRPAPELHLERAALHPEDAARALAIVEDGIARMGPAASLEAAALDLELRLGRRDEALARLDAMIARAERRETLLARRGDLLRGAGRTLEAWESYSTALAALETLPPRRRDAPANRELEARLRAALSGGADR